MRRALVSAAALAPLLAAVATTAFAACPSAGTTTSTAGDIDMASGCTVNPPANGSGVVLNSNNNVTVETGATIGNSDKDNSVGILIDGSAGNLTGNVSMDGAINLSMSYVAPTNSTTGISYGAFATGTGRYGIRLVGPGTLTGEINIGSGSSITVDGNDSDGVSIESGLNGDLIDAGAITMLGNQTVGLNVAGPISGNLDITGAIAATGVGAQGVVVNGSVGGQVTLGSTVTTTGYRETTAPTNQTTLDDMTADQFEQGGSAVAIGGNVAAGVIVSAASTTGTGTAAVTTPAGAITTFGNAPAMVIGAAGQTVVIGNNASDPYGLVVGGAVTAEGVYEQKTSPNLSGPVPATAIMLGVEGGNLDLSGGVHVTGSVSAVALDAQATAINIGNGTSAEAVSNDGTIAASVTADQAGGASVAVVINQGAAVGTIANTGVVSAVVSDSISTSASAYAIEDLSGSVTAVHNTGQIDAVLVPTDNSFVLTGPTVAIDVSHHTDGVGVVISQTPSTTFDGVAGPQFTGSISGTTLTVTSVTSGNLVVGETIYGSGIVAGTTITAEGNGTGGNGTYTISTTQTVSSETLSAASGAPEINGDVLLGNATAANPNVFDIEAGSTRGALTEFGMGADTGNQTTTNRNLDITVNNATVTITKAELHEVTSLNVGATGVLVAAIDPSFAVDGSNPTPIFDTTVHTIAATGVPQQGTDGTATFASGAQIGISLDALQTAQTATYEFVHTSGAPGALNVGTLGDTQLLQAPFLYTAVASVDPTNTNLDVTVSLKSAQQLGLNQSGAAAFNAIFNALEHNSAMAGAIITPTTQAGFLTLYNQLVPDQGLGTFDALEAATEKISNLTDQPPDAGTRIAGSSAWLQEVNTTVKRNDGETLGETDKAFGLVGGLEKMGKAGGALGLTVSYLNIQDAGVYEPIGGQLVTNLVEVGGYYRRAWGNLRISARAAGGYAWFGEDRMFVTTGVSETSKGEWNGYFADAHAGAAYELHLGRFYMRPELSADYLSLDEDAHSDTGAGPGFDVSIAQRVSSRMTGEALLTIGSQFGHDAWFRPEFYAGYREVFFGNIANTVANFTGGDPFMLASDEGKGGWFTSGFALKAGTPLSYVAIVGEVDLRNNEQIYDVYLSGRAMF